MRTLYSLIFYVSCRHSSATIKAAISFSGLSDIRQKSEPVYVMCSPERTKKTEPIEKQ